MVGAQRTQAYLNVYGSRFTFGLQGDAITPVAAPDLVGFARESGCAGIELPVSVVRALDAHDIRITRTLAEQAGLGIVLSSLGTEPNQLRADIGLARSLGAVVLVTAVAETRFGGDRRHLVGKWSHLMQDVLSRLGSVVRDAERAGVVIALENHQDLDSVDMLTLCRTIDSCSLGVAFDCANALGVAEHPRDYLAAVLPYVAHAHMKDYRVQWTADGYALIRCPVGDGIVPFAELVRTMTDAHPAINISIEIGALLAREVRVCAADFWTEHRPRRPDLLASLLAFIGQHCEPAGTDLRTPLEKGHEPAAIIEFEKHELARSIDYVTRSFASWSRRS